MGESGYLGRGWFAAVRADHFAFYVSTEASVGRFSGAAVSETKTTNHSLANASQAHRLAAGSLFVNCVACVGTGWAVGGVERAGELGDVGRGWLERADYWVSRGGGFLS